MSANCRPCGTSLERRVAAPEALSPEVGMLLDLCDQMDSEWVSEKDKLLAVRRVEQVREMLWHQERTTGELYSYGLSELMDRTNPARGIEAPSGMSRLRSARELLSRHC